MLTTYIVPIPAQTKRPKTDFKTYLEQTLNDPFTLNLKNKNLLEVIDEAIKAKSRRSPKYGRSLSCLMRQLKLIEQEHGVTLKTIHVTDVFWDYFVSECNGRGLKPSTIETLANQLRSILNWAV